jgi:hypothetical protein
MAIKRDNWTNDEVLSFLENMEWVRNGCTDEMEQIHSCYTDAINAVRDIFEAFQAPEDSYCGPMAYDTESKLIVYVGPELPR